MSHDGPISFFATGPVLVVYWRESKGQYFHQVIDRVSQAARSQGKLIYVSVTDNRSARPDNEFLAKAREFLPTLMKLCSEIHIVLAGTGVKAAVQRSVMSGVFLVVGKSSQLKISSSLEEALGAALGVEAGQAALRDLLAQGFPSDATVVPRSEQPAL